MGHRPCCYGAQPACSPLLHPTALGPGTLATPPPPTPAPLGAAVGGRGATRLLHPSHRRSRSPALRRRRVPGGGSGRWCSQTRGGCRWSGGSRPRRSRRGSRARRRSGHPRPGTARRRSGAGAGHSAGRRLHPSRPRSPPRCHRPRRPAHNARRRGRQTPTRRNAARTGTAPVRTGNAIDLPRTCCGDGDGSALGCSPPSWHHRPGIPAAGRCWMAVPARCCTRRGDSPVLAALLHHGTGREGKAIPETRALGGLDAATICQRRG